MKKESNQNFAGRLAELMKENSYTKNHLATLTGLHHSVIDHYLSGDYDPQLSSLLKLAKVFSCSLDYLVGRKEY